MKKTRLKEIVSKVEAMKKNQISKERAVSLTRETQQEQHQKKGGIER